MKERALITIHTRKVQYGYTSYIKVYGDGGKPYTIQSGLVHLYKADAQTYATGMADDLKRQNGLIR